MPKISVIVPNYNHASYLKQRIESIINQTFQDFELIILDDCSTDNSKEIIEQYRNHPKISRILYNSVNSGSTFKQWDKGVALAEGEWIWIAESDDFAEIYFLENLYKIINQNDSISLCFANSFVINESNNTKELYNEEFDLYKKNFCLDGNDLIKKFFSRGNIIPNASAVLFNKKFFKIAMPSFTDYKINGDWFLWINILMGNKCAFTCEPLNYFRRHKGAGSPKNIINFKNIEEAMRINVFLRRNGYKVDFHNKSWLSSWLGQANFSPAKILSLNFIPIYKEAIKLYFPLPVGCYLIYRICKFKIKRKL